MKTAIRFNAAMSAITGVVALLFADTLARKLGGPFAPYLYVLGAVLLLHAIALIFVSTLKPLKPWVIVNCALIGPYPFALILLVILGVITTPFGIALCMGDAGLVGFMALWQLKATRTS